MAVIERTGGYHCGACGGPRERLTDTQCLSDAELLRALEPRLERPPQWLALLYAAPFFVGSSLAGGLRFELRCAIALVGVFCFIALVVRGQRQQRFRARRRKFEIEQRIIGLAYQNDGVLREQEVSTRLRISLAESREVLQDLAREERAVAYGQDRQVTEFRFGEARRTRAIRTSKRAATGTSEAPQGDARADRNNRRQSS